MTTAFNNTTSEFYSQEDVQQILHLAIAQQTDSGEMTRVQLEEIAEELGISAMDLQIAEQTWIARRGEDQEKQVFNLYRKQRLRQHTVRFLIVNAFLLTLNVLTAGTLSWSLYIVLGWGVLLALRSWRWLQTEGEDYEEAFQKWRRRRWIKRSFKTFLDRWMN